MENKTIVKRIVIISSVIILIDQIIKFISIKLCADSSIEIIKNVLYFDQTTNIGMAFSLNAGNLKNILISGLILFFIIKYIFAQKHHMNSIILNSLSLVIGGGISNLIDRFIHGGVIDFIRISDFPIFNIADVVIIFGWLLFAFYIIKFELPKK